MRVLLFLAISIFFLVTDSRAQGLNNNFEIDKTDIQNIWEMQGIEVFKFPISVRSKSNLNFIIYQYRNQELVDSINLLSTFKGQGVAKEMIPLLLPELKDSMILRVYFIKENEKIKLSLHSGGQKFGFSKQFDFVKMVGSRAFDVNLDSLKERKRFLAYYGVNDSNKELHCALNDSNNDLSKRMNHVLIFYVEPIIIKE